MEFKEDHTIARAGVSLSTLDGVLKDLGYGPDTVILGRALVIDCLLDKIIGEPSFFPEANLDRLRHGRMGRYKWAEVVKTRDQEFPRNQMWVYDRFGEGESWCFIDTSISYDEPVLSPGP